MLGAAFRRSELLSASVAPSTIAATDVTVRFREIVALDQVSMSLTDGVTALLGENGAGKTTLLRVLARLQRPEAGELRLGGTPVEGRRAEIAYRGGVGYLPQQVPTLRHLNVGQYLEYAGFLKGLPWRTVPAQVSRVLDLVDLGDQRHRRTAALSGGMVRRLGMAVAALGEPRVLLLDEPTVGLDPVQRIELRALVQRCAELAPVLLSTHLSEDVSAVADRVVVLHRGRVAFDDTLAELVGHGQAPGPGANLIERGFLAVVGGLG